MLSCELFIHSVDLFLYLTCLLDNLKRLLTCCYDGFALSMNCDTHVNLVLFSFLVFHVLKRKAVLLVKITERKPCVVVMQLGLEKRVFFMMFTCIFCIKTILFTFP